MKHTTIYFSRILFSVLLIIALPACSFAPRTEIPDVNDCMEREKMSAELEAKIRKEIHATEKALSLDTLFARKAKKLGFNGAVLVAQKGIVLYQGVFGYADLKQKDSLSVNSSFQLASISKTFTGVATLLLAQEGAIKLTDSVQQYIPSFPYHGVTIEHLLSHRSGLPNYLYCFEDKRKLNVTAPSNNTVLTWFAEANPLPPVNNKPGKNFSYNNTNFIVLASIIEKASEMSYPEFLHTRIFEPLGMTHTYVDTIAADTILRYRTSGHQGNTRRAREFFDGVYGDKGIFSSVGDMNRWYFALHSGCLLNQHWLSEAFTPRSFERKSRHNYGLGFRLMTDAKDMTKVHYVYHGGWWAGYSTMFWMDMEADIVIIVLGNRKNNSVYDIKSVLAVLEQNEDPELQEVTGEGGK